VTELVCVTATLDPGASEQPADELGALEGRLRNLGAVAPAATIDERTETVYVRFDIAAEPHQIARVIDTLALELSQVGITAWTLSGIAYYLA
jgi:hypothetical protein